MADPNINLNPSVNPNLIQRTVLVGRVKMAQAIKMPESEWAKLISDVERDGLFQELLDARAEGKRIIKFKRFSRTQLSGQFYESQDQDVVGSGADVSMESMLEKRADLLELIHKIGQDKFERYFMYREGSEPPETIAKECGVTLEQAKSLEDFIVEMSVQAEFYHPSSLDGVAKVRPTMVGQIIKNDDGNFSIAFFSPHLARGMYDIDRGALQRWQKSKKLDRNSSARLRRYIGLLELANMKQGAFWRVLDHLLKVQKPYFETQDPSKMAALSLRKAAAELQFAPSTLSRVFASKSVMMPWGHEMLILDLMPGQRRVVLEILDRILAAETGHMTDAALAHRIAEQHNVRVSRRTITACRHHLDELHRKAA
jgi:DNA-directed RNA polymerase specialized sigma54-like protein